MKEIYIKQLSLIKEQALMYVDLYILINAQIFISKTILLEVQHMLDI